MSASAISPATSATPTKANVLAELHHLLDRLHTEIDAARASLAEPEAATAAEVFARKRGLARDLTHIFIGAARSLAIPARYVAGYMCIEGVEQRSGHAWAEAYVPNLGWIGFDPVKGACPTEAYIRVAVGLDALGAIPVRATHYGSSTENLAVAIEVEPISLRRHGGDAVKSAGRSDQS